MFAAEAKERPQTPGKEHGRGQKVVVNLRQPNAGKATDQAAGVVGVSGVMVTRAKAIKRATHLSSQWSPRSFPFFLSWEFSETSAPA